MHQFGSCVSFFKGISDFSNKFLVGVVKSDGHSFLATLRKLLGGWANVIGFPEEEDTDEALSLIHI